MDPSRTHPPAHVALLRGVNVGGKNRLPMDALVGFLEAAGATDVRTYVQSGNAIFRSPPSAVTGIGDAVASAIEEHLGFRTVVVIRSASEMRAAARGNPFLRSGVDERTLHVAFLAARPAKARVAELDPGRSPPDEIAVRGREAYLRLPNGMARTRFTNAYLDAALATTSTVRNWRTVLALVELAGPGEGPARLRASPTRPRRPILPAPRRP